MEQRVEHILQGRRITLPEIEQIRNLIASSPSWNRTRISKELCKNWDWRRDNGDLKDIACRSLLRKLEKMGYIQLPKGLHQNSSSARRDCVQPILHSRVPVQGRLKSISPIKLELVEKGFKYQLFKYFISAYHYLGWSGTVGENLKYLYSDVHGTPLGCMMWGAAAWKVHPRDSFIGWDAGIRSRNLPYVVNNNRFLILPWVKVPHLASHLLGQTCRRLSGDWEEKYHHPVFLAETFVEQKRFKGTCYKAANWIYVGQTQGRGKLDVKSLYQLPVKDIWLYPLKRFFREKLCTCNYICT